MSLPRHVAIIPDGNRRWARAHGLPTVVGHKKGFERAVELVNASRKLGVHTMTLWAFSTENWGRAKDEVKYLMKLFHDMIDEQLREAHKHKARIVHLGRKDRIPSELAKKIDNAEEETKTYVKHVLNIALDYGGQDEIIRAIARMISKTQKLKNSKTQNLYEEIGYQGKYPIHKFAEYLDTAGQLYPEVDLMIRTSGEMRTSGLLPWQSVYTEYYFAPEPFPDFTPRRLREAIEEFGKRQRRFGGN